VTISCNIELRPLQEERAGGFFGSHAAFFLRPRSSRLAGRTPNTLGTRALLVRDLLIRGIGLSAQWTEWTKWTEWT